MDDFFDSAEDLKQTTLKGILERTLKEMSKSAEDGYFSMDIKIPKLSYEYLKEYLDKRKYPIEIKQQDSGSIVLHISWE